MTISRAALYLGGASLLVAWLSSAASPGLQTRPPAASRVADATLPIDTLAADVEAQAQRLKARLASAPAPQAPRRNPFVFRSSAPRPSRARPSADDQAVPPSSIGSLEPPLALIGIAEQQRPDGTVRTAVLVDGRDELIMAVVGELVLERYEVTMVSADAVELTDGASGRVRRLTLQ